MATVVDMGEVCINNVDRFRFSITKDGVAWTGIDSVTLTFENPDRETTFSVTASMESPDAGVWYYDTLTTDIDDVGYWTIKVRVVDSTITKDYPYEIGFTALSQP